MASRAVELAARLQRLIQALGIEASRHASSMILLNEGRLLATLHVYPEGCRLRLYRPWLRENLDAARRLRELLDQACPGASLVEETPLHQPPRSL